MADAKPNELYAKRDKLKEIISSTKTELKETNREIAKKEGRIFNSIDDYLTASGKKIWRTETIPGSESGWREMEGMGKLKKYLFTDVSEAYDCPYCGIVVGKVEKDKYTINGEEGINYNCIICGEQIGNVRLKR